MTGYTPRAERIREHRVRLTVHETRALQRCLGFESDVEVEACDVRILLLRPEPGAVRLDGAGSDLRLTASATRQTGLSLELARQDGATVVARTEPLPATANRFALRPHVLRELFPELPRERMSFHVWSGKRTQYRHAAGWELALDSELTLSSTAEAERADGWTVPESGLLRWRQLTPPTWLEQVVRAAAPLDLTAEARQAVRQARLDAARRAADERALESWFH